jgi:hypothetical protein
MLFSATDIVGLLEEDEKMRQRSRGRRGIDDELKIHVGSDYLLQSRKSKPLGSDLDHTAHHEPQLGGRCMPKGSLGVVANEVVQPCDWGLTT